MLQKAAGLARPDVEEGGRVACEPRHPEARSIVAAGVRIKPAPPGLFTRPTAAYTRVIAMRGRELLAGRRPALLFVALLGSILGLFLISPSARVPMRTPLVPRPARGPLVAVPLDGRDSQRGTTVHRLALSAVDPQALVPHDELWLFLSPPEGDGGGRLLEAVLHVRDTPCVFDGDDGGPLGFREPLVLRPGPECARLDRSRVDLDLAVEVAGSGAMALWAHSPRDESAEFHGIEVTALASGGAGVPLRVRGFVVDYPPTAPRVELLNDMWRISPSTRWLWLLLGGAVGLALAGCVVFPTRRAPQDDDRPTPSFVLSSGAGAALLAGSLTVLYAALTPPLMGPDEPYHLLGLAELVGEDSWPDETVAWMGQTHLLRIRHHSKERFRTVDRDNPHVADDPELRPTEVEMRSGTLAVIWRFVGSALRGQPAPRVLLTIRLLNALLCALTLGVMTALAAACAAAAYPQWLCFPFLFVPALPFFAMHVSETAVLCSIYIFLAMSLTLLFLDGPRAHWAGLPLGLATGSMLAAGRSPWPMAAIVAAALIARIALGPCRQRNERRSAFIFWSGFALGGAVFYLLLNDAFRRMLFVYVRFVPEDLMPAVVWLLESPVAVAGLLASAAALEMSLSRLRPAANRLARPTARVVRWGALAVAGLVVLSLLGSLLLPYPHLPLEPRYPLTAGERVVMVLTTMATMFRLQDPNFLLFTSFWAGFGWLDTIPPALFLALLALLTAVALVGLLVHLAREPQVRRLLWLVALGVGSTLSLILYTLSTQNLPMALQGRYLIGWYLVILGVIGSGVALVDRPSAEALPGPIGRLTRIPRGGLLLGLSGLIHVYCLCFILWRYF